MNRLLKAIVCGFFVLIVSMAAVPLALGAPPSSSSITYQGQLTLDGEKVNHVCDFCFRLWDAVQGGNPRGNEICQPSVQVEDGVFTTTLDFGTPDLQIDLLWIEIKANCFGAQITLAPRQQVTATPRALHTQGITIDASGNAKVDGMIESTDGGFKLPDGTTMAAKNDLVTSVTAGAGLTGDHTGGDVTLSASFGGVGSATTASRSDHYHSKLRTSDGDPNALVVDSVGRVGIGETSPGAKLDVNSGTVNTPGTRITQWDNHILLKCVAPSGHTTPTHAGSITVNGELNAAGTMNFGGRSTSGIFETNIMSLFFSDSHMVVYGLPYRNDNKSTWEVPSDRRLKRNIQPLTRSLDRLLDLHGVSFEFIESNSPPLPRGTQTGFVAQDVEKVFPEWVSESSEGYKAVAFSGFEALTVESLRQLRDEKDAEIAELKLRIERLEQLLETVASGKGGE